jgi:hypothetical protein
MRKAVSLVIGSLLASIACSGPALAQDAAPAVKATAKRQITAEQRERLDAKLRLVDQIMRAAEPDMQAQQVSPESRRWLMESMYKMSLEQLQSVGAPGTFAGTSAAITRTSRMKALGDTSTDLVYHPIPPCRFIDTRNVGGPISGSRTFDLDATGDVYGGSAGCNIVAAAGTLNADDFAAIALNAAIVSPTNAPGFLGARPPGSGNTTALVNWYQSGPSVQASNAGVISTFQGLGDEIEFFGSPTQLIVDVFGVFTEPNATALNCTTQSALITVTNGTFNEIQTPGCPAGTTLTGGSCGWQSGGSRVTGLSKILGSGEQVGGVAWLCGGTNNVGGDRDLQAIAICCKVPGR